MAKTKKTGEKETKEVAKTEEKRIFMLLQWTGLTKELYEKARKSVNLEGNIPYGLILHIASFDDKGIRVTDIWESAESFNKYVQDRLMPELKKLNVTSEPHVEIYPLYALFAPACEIKK